MTERSVLHAGVMASPDDDDARLVFADWLEEQGDLARADLIRHQCALARLPAWERGALEAAWAIAPILRAHGARFRAELPMLDGVEWTDFHRGFPSAVRVRDLAALQLHADSIARAAPVWRVVLEGIGEDPPELDVPWLRVLALRDPEVDEAPAITNLGRELEIHSSHYAQLPWLAARGEVPLVRIAITGEHTAGRGFAEVLANLPAAAGLTALELGTDFVDYDSGYFDDPTLREAGAIALAAARFEHLEVLGVDRQRVGDAGLAALVTSLPRLRELSARANEVGHLDEVARSAGAPIMRLDLGGNPIGDTGARALAASPRFGRLESLALDTCDLGHEGLAALTRAPFWARLRALEIDRNPLGVGAAVALVDAPVPHELHTLSIGDADFTSECAKLLPDVAWLRRLLSLDLSRNALHREAPAVAGHLAHSSLRRLRLASTQLRAPAAEALSPLWAKLVELDVSANPLGDAGLDALVTGDVSSLQVLSLAYCDLTGVGIHVLAARARCPQLATLSLANNPLDADAIRALLRAKLLEHLAVLDLSGCRLTRRAAELLAASPALARLERLRLRDNPLEEAGLLALAGSPHLRGIRSIELSGEPWSYREDARAILADRFGPHWHYAAAE